MQTPRNLRTMNLKEHEEPTNINPESSLNPTVRKFMQRQGKKRERRLRT